MGEPQQRRAAVLGHPIAHSLSPVLHRAAYAALGLTAWSYEAVDVEEAELAGFVSGLDASWAGLSLTMPLKQTVLPLLTHVEPLAEVVGAVNTVLFSGAGASRVLVGANTDVHGVVAALAEGGATRASTAVVLGGGATAASTLAALAQLGCPSPVVLVRSQARAGALMRAAHRMGVTPTFRPLDEAAARVGGADVVISTLPPHAADDLASSLARAWADAPTKPAGAWVDGPASGGAPRPRGVLLDVAYDPRPTALHAAWVAAGGVAVGGERMLLHQAAEQVRLMTGHPAPVAAMSAALEARLAPGSSPDHV